MAELQRFKATGAYGAVYTVIKRSRREKRSWLPHRKEELEFVLSDGRGLVRQGGDMYKIAESGDLLFRLR
jgi:hypothetical protein